MCCWTNVKYIKVCYIYYMKVLARYFVYCGFICTCVSAHMWRSEDKLWGQFSPSTMWVQGIKLRSSDLVVSSSTHRSSPSSLCLVLITGKHSLCGMHWEVFFPFYFMEFFWGTLVFFKNLVEFIHKYVCPWTFVDYFCLLIFQLPNCLLLIYLGILYVFRNLSFSPCFTIGLQCMSPISVLYILWSLLMVLKDLVLSATSCSVMLYYGHLSLVLFCIFSFGYFCLPLPITTLFSLFFMVGFIIFSSHLHCVSSATVLGFGLLLFFYNMEVYCGTILPLLTFPCGN